MARMKLFAVALAMVSVPAFATDSGTANIVAGAALAILGGTPPDQDKPKDHYFPPNTGVRNGGAIQSCGTDDIGQRYPGFTQTYCRVSPNAESSPLHPVQKDKSGS